MDYIIFNQPGGFPLTTNILEYLQTFHKPKINALASMAGSKAIINGCEEEGAKVLGGNIVIDGEMYGLIEGIKQEYITVKEDKQTVEFENGQNKATIIYRYAVFGTGANSYKWSDFKRVPALNSIQDQFNSKVDKTTFDTLVKRVDLLEKVNAPDFKGMGIRPFFGTKAEIPAGYAIVGSGVGRMLVGIDETQAEFNTVLKTGGKKTILIGKDNLPALSGSTNGITLKGDKTAFGLKTGTNTWVHPADINVTGGSGKEIPNLPPYLAVYFLKWVGIGNGING